MALRYNSSKKASRRAFFATGLSVYVFWNIGTALGSLGASALSDPAAPEPKAQVLLRLGLGPSLFKSQGNKVDLLHAFAPEHSGAYCGFFTRVRGFPNQ